MLPYLILIISPFVFSYVSLGKKGTLQIGKNELIQKNNLAIAAFFFVFFIILSLRHHTIGNDVFWYKWSFEQSITKSLQAIMNEKQDMLYYTLSWLVRKITDDFQVFLCIISGLIIIPVYNVYKQDRRHSILKLVLFMNMATFIMFFSGLRQSIAIAMGLVAYQYVKEKKLVKFLIVVLVAIGFHHSAFILFLMYPIYHIRIKKKHLLVLIPFMTFMYVFNKQIFGVMVIVLKWIFGNQYNAEITATGAYATLVLFVIFTFYSFVVPDEAKFDNETYGLRNIMVVATVLQFFAPLHYLAMRFNYYYVIFVPVAMAKFMCVPQHKFRKIAKIAEIIIIVYFLRYYLVNTYEDCITGISSLNIYPYKAFWSN